MEEREEKGERGERRGREEWEKVLTRIPRSQNITWSDLGAHALEMDRELDKDRELDLGSLATSAVLHRFIMPPSDAEVKREGEQCSPQHNGPSFNSFTGMNPAKVHLRFLLSLMARAVKHMSKKDFRSCFAEAQGAGAAALGNFMSQVEFDEDKCPFVCAVGGRGSFKCVAECTHAECFSFALDNIRQDINYGCRHHYVQQVKHDGVPFEAVSAAAQCRLPEGRFHVCPYLLKAAADVMKGHVEKQPPPSNGLVRFAVRGAQAAIDDAVHDLYVKRLDIDMGWVYDLCELQVSLLAASLPLQLAEWQAELIGELGRLEYFGPVLSSDGESEEEEDADSDGENVDLEEDLLVLARETLRGAGGASVFVTARRTL